jgi:signal transduction histidine kinase
MRERVTALGGTVTAGPAPGGGFAVSARLPVVRSRV